MPNEKSPAYQWYPKDILSSIRVAKLSLAEEGAYRRALDFCWLNNGLPYDAKELASIIGKGCTIKIAEKILPLFTKKRKNQKVIINERQEIERSKQAQNRIKNIKSGQKGASQRWSKKLLDADTLDTFGQNGTKKGACNDLKHNKINRVAMVSPSPNDSISIAIPISSSISISSSDKESVTHAPENILKIFKKKYPEHYPNYDFKIKQEKKQLDEITDGLEDTINAENSENKIEKLEKLKSDYEKKLTVLKIKKDKIISDEADLFFNNYNMTGWVNGKGIKITNMESAVVNWLYRKKQIDKQQKK